MSAESMPPQAEGLAQSGAAVRPMPRAAFILIWLSDAAFDVGSALMSFALGVWIFQQTGSAQLFSGAVVAASLPALLMTPIAGALADRFDRRWLIAGCDIASVLMIGLLAVSLSYDLLDVAHLYLFNAATAIVVSLRTPAYVAVLGAIVPRDKLTQASGLVGMTQNMLQIGAPLLAGFLMGSIGLAGVVVVKMVLSAAAGMAAVSALSRVRHAIRGTQEAVPLPIFKATAASFSAALRYFRNAPLMSGLASYGVLQDSLLALCSAMMIPLVLSVHSSAVLGVVLTSGAVGGVCGSLVLLIAGVKRRLMFWVLPGNAAVALFVLLIGVTRSPFLLSVCAFLALLAHSAAGGCALALWVRKTPAASRGSILALLGSLNLLMTCVLVLGGGSVGERIFEPALVEGGIWADSIGPWVGVGKGRGLGFIFILCGVCSLLMSLLALAHARFRRLDELVLDPPDEPLPQIACGHAVAS